jgi:hypothetical protein
VTPESLVLFALKERTKYTLDETASFSIMTNIMFKDIVHILKPVIASALMISCTMLHSIFLLVGPDGVVCISILHEPGDDKYGYETASERWLPVHTVETILVSVISMISDPNDESPANVDAAVSIKCCQYFIFICRI